MTNVPMLVLRALMTKRGWHAFSHLVKVDSFESLDYRRVYQHLERLHGETASDVTIAGLRADFEVQYAGKPEGLGAEMALVLDRLGTAEELAQDLMESLVRRFLERSVSFEIAKYVSDFADRPEFSVSHVTDLASRAVEIGGRVATVVTDILAGPLSGSADNRRIAHPLGVSAQLDRGLRGGVAGGELVLYLAPPAVGKTSFLCRTGASHAARGGRVLHVTLEINTRKVRERYDQCWTGLTLDEVEAPVGQGKVQQAREVVAEAGGRVWVVDWSYMNASPADVGALVRRMAAMGMDPDMVIIDYLELMAPSKVPGKEMRQAYSAIGKETRALARNLEVPVVSAWQANRASADVLLLSQKDVSESWDIVKVADIILGLNRSGEELLNKILRINIIKQREGTAREYFELYCDLDRMVVRDRTARDEQELVDAVTGRRVNT